MSAVQQFEDLKIWQMSRVLANEIYLLLKDNKDYGFRDQIQRASVSVMNNISEGFERRSNTEFKRFLDISKSSCGEVRSMLYLAEDLMYIDKDLSRKLRKDCKLLAGSIANMMKSLKY